LVNVVDDPERGRRLEAIYASLEREINQNFPDSVVRLSLVGDKLLVRGQAKDVEDAAQILRIVGANAPGGPESVPVRNVDLNLVSGLNPNGDAAFQDGEIQSMLLRTAEKDAAEAGSTVINMLRVPGEHQVMLKVIVAEVNRNALRAIGANMSIGPGNSTNFLSAFGSPTAVQGLNSNIVSAEGGTFGINRGDFQLAINALRRVGYAKTLAEPNVVALDGQPAIFRAGDTFPVPAANVSFGAAAQSVSQQFVGVQIRFLPVITDKDRVRLQLSGTVSALDNNLTANVGGTNVPGTNTRNFFTTVELREGQTLALAGLISRSSQTNSSRVPFAGDLPGLGRLFNTDDSAAQEQELLILVTPQLVHPLEESERLPLPGSDVVEPDDIEFYLEGRIEGGHLEGYRSPVRTSWERMKAYRRAQQKAIIGPSGYSDDR
jgi:pilus assembly protein CpaC